MQLEFEEMTLPPQTSVERLWEASKFPFKIRIGQQSPPGRDPVFRWTVLGSYVNPEVSLAHGKSASREKAEYAAITSLESLLKDLAEWVEYAQSLL